ncbi:solute carrier family 2, facilitated glucose transporter member 11-like [Engraulis encrasicolus]|uniref:solute carrier family 2, facilitated glucose transporter member 11-like n=1 Tax=Engraulis encrasicolus TaxID=184585 RepID=UPI002FD61E73
MVCAIRQLLQSPLLTAAIFITGIGGTFQYGFHIAVLNSPSTFIKELVNVTCTERYGLNLLPWQLSIIWSFVVSIFCIGGLMGALMGGRLADKYGRKRCLLWNNLLGMAGAVLMVLSKTAVSFEMIMAARFIYGVNAGIGLTVHCMYLPECSPKKLRSMMGFFVITFIPFGKFISQLLGLSEVLGTEDRWPWLLGFSAVLALLQMVTLPLLPESPQYLLIMKGDPEACEQAMMRLWGPKVDHSEGLADMRAEAAVSSGLQRKGVLQLFRQRSLRWQLATIICCMTTLQLSGINAVYLYSFDVFRKANIPPHQLRYAALGTGLCELSTNVISAMVIERTGKKVLLLWGYFGMATTLTLLTVTLYLQTILWWMSYCSLILVFIFIMFFSSGPAGITTPLAGELFNQSFKAAAFTVNTTINWTGLFLIGMLFPLIVEHLYYLCFIIFLTFCFSTGLFVHFNVPETRNRTVLEIAAEYDRMHSRRRQEAAASEEQEHTPSPTPMDYPVQITWL